MQQIEERIRFGNDHLDINEHFKVLRKDIKNLLHLTSIYEKELLNHVPVTYLDDIKKEVFK